jgi:predicted DNA-binding ribbon-helix-helix protein
MKREAYRIAVGFNLKQWRTISDLAEERQCSLASVVRNLVNQGIDHEILCKQKREGTGT